MTPSDTHHQLLGRTAELHELAIGLERVASGQGCAYALVGEPGIGKTQLATAIATQATASGFAVHWGRAWETGGAPAYWPWRQVLESMQPQLASRAPEGPLALLWGHQRAGDFSTSDPAQARFELFDAVVRVLREQGQRQPTLCVLDDLHAADIASLELTIFAAGALNSSRIACVLTCRESEPQDNAARDALTRLLRRATKLTLRRLSFDETATLVRRSLPEANTDMVETLFRATSGNPLFLAETVRELAAGHAWDLAKHHQLPVAQGVALVVRDKLVRLESAEREALEAGAVIGREVPVELLASVLAEPLSKVKVLVQRLVSIGLWIQRGADHWLFSHALVRDALEQELTPARRAELHLKVAQVLDERVKAGHHEWSLARAHHALEAPKTPELVVQWVIAAAQQARAQRAYEEGVALLERARRELSMTDEQRIELLLVLGWAYGDLGEASTLQSTFDEALVLARKIKSSPLLARAVLGKGSQYLLGSIRVDLINSINEALSQLSENEVTLRARLLARKASAMMPAAMPDEPLALARQALKTITGSKDTPAVLDVAVAAGSALGDFAVPQERIEVNNQLVRLAREQGDRVLELRGLSRLVTDHFEAGDVAGADAFLLERDALATSLGHARFRWMTPVFRSMRAMLEGRFDVCDQAFVEAQQLALAASDDNALRCVAVHRAWVLLLQDRMGDVRAHEPDLLRRLQGVIAPFSEILRAQILARSGFLAPAALQLRRATGEHLHHLYSNNMLAVVAETAALVKDIEIAQLTQRALQPHIESNATVGLFGLACGVPVRALLGLLSHTLGAVDEAREHFELALERTDMMGARAHEVWVRLWYGEALMGQPPERAAAREILERCAALARQLHMPGVAERAELATSQAPIIAKRMSAVSSSFPRFTLTPHQSGWKLDREGVALMLKDSRGLGMLARLLERPGQELHCLELVSESSDEGRALDSDAGEVLDEKAKSAYRRRIEQLSVRIEDSEERGDAAGAEGARSELETLSRELSRAVGLGGRSRRIGSRAERARVTAQRRLREAIKRIGELDAEVSQHLERTIRTGTFCAYEPNRRVR